MLVPVAHTFRHSGLPEAGEPLGTGRGPAPQGTRALTTYPVHPTLLQGTTGQPWTSSSGSHWAPTNCPEANPSSLDPTYQSGVDLSGDELQEAAEKALLVEGGGRWQCGKRPGGPKRSVGLWLREPLRKECERVRVYVCV